MLRYHNCFFSENFATPVVLNVTFPPQPKSKKTIQANLGESVNITIEFDSNPIPNITEWVEEAPGDNGLVIGSGSDKYQIEDLVALSDTKFQATLRINAVTEDDLKNNFYLMATNSLGTQKYEFSLTTDDTSTSQPQNMTVYIIIGVAGLLSVMFLSIVIYKKCCSSGNETAPLL